MVVGGDLSTVVRRDLKDGLGEMKKKRTKMGRKAVLTLDTVKRGKEKAIWLGIVIMPVAVYFFILFYFTK